MNFIITILVIVLKKYGVYIAFSPQGYALVGLLVSFLVLNKLHYALDRYNQIRMYIGQACIALRELHQVAIIFTTSTSTPSCNQNELDQWKIIVRNQILLVLSSTIKVLQNDKLACYLARNEFRDEIVVKCKDAIELDPTIHTQRLRQLLYQCNTYFSMNQINDDGKYLHKLELLERMKLLDILMIYCTSYRELIRLVSTPIPFPMIQMGRTFLFLWIYTMPIALVGLDYQISAVLAFIFFLSYGYIGVELVAMQLIHPFGYNHVNDDIINVKGMEQATERGIRQDSETTFDMILPAIPDNNNTNNHRLAATTPSSSSSSSHDEMNNSISLNNILFVHNNSNEITDCYQGMHNNNDNSHHGSFL